MLLVCIHYQIWMMIIWDASVDADWRKPVSKGLFGSLQLAIALVQPSILKNGWSFYCIASTLQKTGQHLPEPSYKRLSAHFSQNENLTILSQTLIFPPAIDASLRSYGIRSSKHRLHKVITKLWYPLTYDLLNVILDIGASVIRSLFYPPILLYPWH